MAAFKVVEYYAHFKKSLKIILHFIPQQGLF